MPSAIISIKRVFPELFEWCERRKLRLVDIDLRWGVSEQDAIGESSTLARCLACVDECRPFFLCFLGQRRGWVPARDAAVLQSLAPTSQQWVCLAALR